MTCQPRAWVGLRLAENDADLGISLFFTSQKPGILHHGLEYSASVLLRDLVAFLFPFSCRSHDLVAPWSRDPLSALTLPRWREEKRTHVPSRMHQPRCSTVGSFPGPPTQQLLYSPLSGTQNPITSQPPGGRGAELCTWHTTTTQKLVLLIRRKGECTFHR